MRILLRVAVCVALLWVSVSGESGVEVVFGEGPNTKGEVSVYVSQLVQDWIAESLRQARPGSRLASVKDAGANLDWRRLKDLIGAGGPDALANIGGAMGAKTMEAVDVVQNGDQLSVTVTRFDQTGRAIAKDQVVVSTKDWFAAFDTLAAFAKRAASQMAQAMPEKPQAETYQEETYQAANKDKAAAEAVKDGHAEARANQYSVAPPRQPQTAR